MLGQPALVAEIDKVRRPYNVSVLNCRSRLFALELCRCICRPGRAELRAQRTRAHHPAPCPALKGYCDSK